MSEEETTKLIAEAKKMFPIGTKFFPAHVPSQQDKDRIYLIVTRDSRFEFHKGRIYLYIGEDFYMSNRPTEYGNTDLNRIVYDQGRWAVIIELGKPKEVPLFN